jgi:chaperone BCS1
MIRMMANLHIYRVGYRPFLFNRMTGRSVTSTRPASESFPTSTIVLTTIGWSLRPLQDFLKTCHEYKVLNSAGTTTIYFSGSASHYSYGGGK